jgi:serine/threonine-protein kinase
MGVIVRVLDVDIDRPLAIKLLLESNAGAALRERFLAEGRITGQLQHPGIPAVHEVGSLADGRPFFSMKLIEGRTLAELLRARPTPQTELPRFLKVFEQICQTMAYAHAQGVIHRDLKPHNVMVGAFGEVQVMDWGLAKTLRGPDAGRGLAAEGSSGELRARGLAEAPRAGAPTDLFAATSDWTGGPPEAQTTAWEEETPEARTAAGQVLGTLAYMPPEQANAQLAQLDARADVFGLGALLCEILTGQPPYTATGSAELFRRAREADLADAFARLESCGAEVALTGLARSYLAADPGRRPANAEVVAGQVTAYLHSVQERLRQAELDRVAAQVRAGAERTKRRWQLALAGLLVLSLLAGGAVCLWYLRDQSTRAERRDLLSADLRKELTELTRQRDQLRRQLADRLQAAALLSDLQGWKTQVDRIWDTWHRADALRKAGADLLDEHLAREVEQEEDRIRADEEDWKTAHQLDDIRLRATMLFFTGSVNTAQAATRYQDVFAKRKLDLESGEPAQLAAQVRALPIRYALVAALDHWAKILSRYDSRLPRLLAIARAADPDPWGDQVRDPQTWANKEKLLALAARGVPAGASPRLVLLLAWKVNVHDNQAATTLVRQALLVQPRDFWLHYDLGTLVKDRGERVGCFRAALALRPDSAIAHYNLGWALYENKDLDDAEQYFRQALQLQPGLAPAHNGLGSVCLDRQDVDSAIRHYRDALKLDSAVAHVHHNLGTALYRKQDLDSAVEAFHHALTLDPNFSFAHFNLGVVLKKQGKFVEAAKSFRKCLELGANPPGLTVSPAQMVKECERLAELDAKLTAFLQGNVRPRNAAEQLELGRLCAIRKLHVVAAGFYKSALDADPTLAVGWVRYDGACEAALAAAGQGQDAAKLGESEKSRLRRLALVTLQTELAYWSSKFQADPMQAVEVQTRMKHWQQDPDLASVRHAANLAQLPGDEGKVWQQLWTDVESLLRRARAAAKKP